MKLRMAAARACAALMQMLLLRRIVLHFLLTALAAESKRSQHGCVAVCSLLQLLNEFSIRAAQVSCKEVHARHQSNRWQAPSASRMCLMNMSESCSDSVRSDKSLGSLERSIVCSAKEMAHGDSCFEARHVAVPGFLRQSLHDRATDIVTSCIVFMLSASSASSSQAQRPHLAVAEPCRPFINPPGTSSIQQLVVGCRCSQDCKTGKTCCETVTNHESFLFVQSACVRVGR